MIPKTACLLSVCTAMSIACYGQDTLPNAPLPAGPSIHSNGTSYTPPTQGERFKSYIKGTYGPTSILEAAVRGGIAQKRDEPSEWPQGGQGYANRFGSSMGMIAIRGTTTYLVADLFKEDLRPVRCGSGCQESKFKVAFKNSFMARKGNDGHEAISLARISAPWAASAVAVNTWYPSGYGGGDIATQAGISYGLLYVRNYVVQLFAH